MLERITISFFGRTNAGKSSLINAVTSQDVSIVSDIPGTTTDPVKKVMELLPLGPVTMIDTPGLDDQTELGEARIEKTMRILDSTQIAVLVTESPLLSETEKEIIAQFEKRKLPYLVCVNKCDNGSKSDNGGELTAAGSENSCVQETPDGTVYPGEAFENLIFVSAKTGFNIRLLKEKIGEIYAKLSGGLEKKSLVWDLVAKLSASGSRVVVLVIPVDEAAPKDRLILPQQMVLRELIEHGALPLCCTPETLTSSLDSLSAPPSLVITDSQAFGKVNALLPPEIPLTSFSILMARYKGTLQASLEGVAVLDSIKDGDKILISEGCTHHRQCGDIGTVKLPAWIRSYCKAEPVFEFSSGQGFPEDLSSFRLIIHCGGCMLNENEMQSRARHAKEQKVPLTNYGMAIAKMNGILPRSLAPLE